ncbi:pyruvate dehydrogenase complex dihydrolipoamide acetyltransferase [Cardinium endosymbiont of Culicoides punctatus]|uniref:pyruvate dehydrogenase complex dihydrolipoamide acetyltransferase n=1 Tax=Cardinium endosymbiont of Culicoides punctatus TaxID=2304601 RepID=UPI0010586631|nr:pyruvate dehydrogenase complex dihydrolipoamide acetyltransferase [Cardinium endosymbiont of Culicoides punctatus]TDG94489.1 Dihydrolipoyllysine-residue acetyltransferase component of pyruvate dehydrogenase complex [Cardinium endosymbiont of Culicoides punctatus]
MAELIKMPKMSDTMQHGVISRWLKQVGDTVAIGDILAEVETDKATMELEAYEDGTLLYIGVPDKAAVPINDIIAIIGAPGEDINALLAQQASKAEDTPSIPIDVSEKSNNSPPVVTYTTDSIPTTQDPQQFQELPQPSERLFASPLAKKIAKEKGYDITQIQGSGEAGRVIKKDVMHFAPSRLNEASEFADPFSEAYQDQSLSSMRQTMAKVLTESKVAAPHFYLTMTMNMDKIVALRPELNMHSETKISINDLVTRAVALTLKKHPQVNTAWIEDKIRFYQHVHIGVAVAIEDGLIVPVVRFADKKTLAEISTEVKILSTKAHQKKLTPQDYTGATFTISNLGMLGVESFTSIINPPASCILAVGAMQQMPIVKDNQIVVAYVMKVTLSCDHRVVDGAVGASFLSTLKALMEQPLSLLL